MNPLFGPSVLPYLGIRIIESVKAVEPAEKPSFPVSKHRSKRVHKKLVKRHGPQWPMIPAIFKTPDGFIAHPAAVADLRRTLREVGLG